MSQGRQHAARVVLNTGLGGVHQAIAILVSFLLLPIMLSRMGTVAYGVLLVVQILSLNGMLAYAEFGLHSAVIRELAFLFGKHDDALGRRTLASGIWAFTALGGLLGVLTLALGDVVFFRVFRLPADMAHQIRVGYVLYGATLWLHWPLRVIKGFLVAVHDFVLLKAWESVERILVGVGTAVAVVLRPTIVSVIVAELAVLTALAVGFTAWTLARHRGRFTLSPALASFGRVRGLLPLGGHMFVSHLSLSFVNLEGPKILAAMFLGPVGVTQLAILTKVPRAIKTFASSVNAALFPAVAALQAKGDRATIRRLISRGSRYGYALLTPILAFVAVYAADILRVWVGEEYVSLAWLLRAFVAWQFLATLPMFLRSAFTQTEEYGGILGSSLLGNAAFLAIALGGLRALGLWAIVIGLCVGALIPIVGSLRVHRQLNGLDLREFVAASLAAPTISGVVALGAFLLVARVAPAPGLAALCAIFLAGAAVYWAVFYRAVMPSGERAAVHEMMRLARLVP